MVLDSLRVFEGNNVKKSRRIIKVALKKASDAEVKSYLKAYLRACFLLGLKERLVDVESEDDRSVVWVSYTQEEVSKYILYNILSNMDDIEKLAERASGLVNHSLAWRICCSARNNGLPVIDLSEFMWQIGYGTNSVIISKRYQSYENMDYVEISRDRKALWDCLTLSRIPRVRSKIIYSDEDIEEIYRLSYPISIRGIHKSIDINISTRRKEELMQVVSNMMKIYNRVFAYEGEMECRCFCIKGECRAAFALGEGWKEISVSSSMKELCSAAYNEVAIEFMYVDFLKCGDKLKIADMGCVFDIEDELEGIYQEIINIFIDFLKTMNIGTIPLVAVTGTNGKTTTARLIHNILNELGISAGLTSTGGIFIGKHKCTSGDTTGFLSARELLKNRSVSAAVLETARGGIYRNGLGYENAAAAIITSLSEDHIGMEGISNLQDLAYIKSVILEEVHEKGKIIIKAQQELLEFAKLKKAPSEICLIAKDKNEMISSHISNGGEALYVSQGIITICRDMKETQLISLMEVPFTHGGCSSSNILNVMFSIAGAEAVTGDITAVAAVVKKLQCDLTVNPGRQNIIDFEDYKVILDYGHNSEAFNEIFNIARELKPMKITSIIAAPGDRMDIYIEELGEIAGRFSNKIIIREQADLRGRQQGESAGLLKRGVLKAGFLEENLSIILKEEDAIVEAMKEATKGEIIILFTQCLDVIIPAMNRYLSHVGREDIGHGVDLSH